MPPATKAALTVDELRERPTVTVAELAPLIGVSEDAMYEAIARGEAPWPILRLGRCIRIPTAPVLASLGVEP